MDSDTCLHAQSWSHDFKAYASTRSSPVDWNATDGFLRRNALILFLVFSLLIDGPLILAQYAQHLFGFHRVFDGDS